MAEEQTTATELPVPAGDTVQDASGAQRRRVRRHRALALKAVPDVNQPAEAEQDNVIHILQRLREEAQEKPDRKFGWPLISAVACVLIPTLLAAFYYLFFAADQYVSETRFSVRTNDTQAADALGMLTGMPRATVVSDSYIVSDYILSREMVAELEKRLPIRQIYSDPRADFLTRIDPETSQEGLLSYWEGMVNVLFDTMKSTVTVEVRAFDATHAERITTEIVEIMRKLVNDISAQSRRDSVQFASAEVARAELRIRGAREDILAFRTENNEFDPSVTASATLSRVAQLETERSQLNSQMAAIAGYLADDAPSVQMLRSRITALGEEIARVQGEISSDGSGSAAGAEASPGAPSGALASVVAKYQELALNQEFAETTYAAALASLERARTEADRTQTYLAVYLQPSVPDAATYPNRILNIFIVLVVCCVAWAVGSLAYLTVRDHMA